MTDHSKLKKILSVFGGILMVVLIALFFHYESKRQALADEIYNVYTTYTNGELEEARHLAEKLDEPYRSYYVDYIAYAIEIESWTGTEKELYEWLLEFLERYEEYKNVKVPNSDLWNFESDYQDLNHQLDCIGDALTWYPEYCQIKESFYETLFAEMRLNCERYISNLENGYVKVEVSEIVARYEAMTKFYQANINDIKEIQTRYKMNEVFSQYLESEIETMKMFYEEGFVRNSLYTVYSDQIENNKKYLYVNTTVAKENYRTILNNYDIVISNYHNDEFWEEVIDKIVASDPEEHGLDDSITTLAMFSIIDDAYMFETLAVTDSKIVDIEAIYVKCFER